MSVINFPSGKTHVLAELDGPEGVFLTLRKINQNGYKIIQSELTGLHYLEIPNNSGNTVTVDNFWPVLGYFTETEGNIVKTAREANHDLNGKKILRNLRANELVVKNAA